MAGMSFKRKKPELEERKHSGMISKRKSGCKRKKKKKEIRSKLELEKIGFKL